MLFKILICFLAGMGAGLGTGFAGMSAAVVVSPMLITFLGVPAYEAIGIALASDVLASAVSAYTYKKNGNLDVKHGSIMMGVVLLFTLIGSFMGKVVADNSNSLMSTISLCSTFLLGMKFIIWPVTTTKEAMNNVSPKKRLIQSILGGIVIGCICGFMGAGGGMMMLLILTIILNYEIKCAVGTSVFIMTFTALTGAVSHFVINQGIPKEDILPLILCILFTFGWAQVAAVIANKVDGKVLNRITGGILAGLGALMLIMRFAVQGESLF
ncbi:MAG: sulfite exporter TauE/SafE family protein [Lachnospiraceae bacterium]|nr:sulfite exporter TauE/SafE family protein [Lachnospiraceae bacterium]MBR1568649.1 sulfite exporter TauE/SafE family protein [Lachnospiraceae bacterium]